MVIGRRIAAAGPRGAPPCPRRRRGSTRGRGGAHPRARAPPRSRPPHGRARCAWPRAWRSARWRRCAPPAPGPPASSRSAGCTASTRPSRSISSALTCRPVQISSSARARPTMPGRRTGAPRAGKPAPQCLGQREGRVRGGEAHVARQRQLGRARARRPVERGDDDLREGLERIEETVARAHQLEDLLLGIARPHRRVQNAHREELSAAAGDDDGLSLLVAGQPIRDPLQRRQDLSGEPVLVGGPVQRDRDHGSVAIDAHLVGCWQHGHVLLMVSYSYSRDECITFLPSKSAQQANDGFPGACRNGSDRTAA